MSQAHLPPQPVALLQKLVRFDTTNPPGNEAECLSFLNAMLQATGIKTTILARTPNRPNLIARLQGRGEAPPLLFYGHLDVVTTTDQQWAHPPFSGEIVDGFVWGRGTLDMKGGVAMMVSALLQAKTENRTPAGDVILALLSDEEAGGEYGAKYLVENHAPLFSQVRYAIGEGGGMTVHIAGRKFYTIMVAEKQICSLKVALRGPGGHGSMPLRGGAMAKLADVLHKLDRQRLPVHITPVVRHMIDAISTALPLPQRIAMRRLLDPALTDWILDRLGEQGRRFDALLHNTVSPTIVHGGFKINVIPSQVTLELDGRLLPGFTPEDMLREMRQLLGYDLDLEVTAYDPGPNTPDTKLFDMLAGILNELDPDGIPIPLLVSGVTDARFFARLGIQTYGFLPMDIPNELIDTIHGADERIPVQAVEMGTNAMIKILEQYPG
jgi:acetylornithine deacetylase/succinyl-diaminopimelate desuccinylase-like protein